MGKPTAKSGFVARLKEQIEYLQNEDYVYNTIYVYAVGISEPWEFSYEDEFEIREADNLLVVRDGSGDGEDSENEGVPEYIFPLQHIVATELSEE